MQVNIIVIKHPIFGEITINRDVDENIQNLIGDVVGDYDKTPVYYHADIIQNDNGTFTIKKLKVIKPESINIGWMQNKKGNKTFITVITNRLAGEDVVIYPSAVLSIIYENQQSL